MNKHYYKKSASRRKRQGVKLLGLTLFLLGFTSLLYIFFPLISWQIYFAPNFTSQTLASPIPQINLVTKDAIGSFVSQAGSAISGIDYTNAANWFPGFNKGSLLEKPKISSYTLSIRKINVEKVNVSTEDTDLSKHLVHYPGTALPPDSGNSVIFGHSTLPQLFNKNDYKTIFANLYKLKNGDVIETSVQGVLYKHTVYSITIVDPQDTQALSQTYDNSYLTLVTCTPPGTTWKRLIVKARLEKL